MTRSVTSSQLNITSIWEHSKSICVCVKLYLYFQSCSSPPTPHPPVLPQTIESLFNKSSSFIGMMLCYQSIFITLFIYEARSVYNKATRATLFLALGIVQKMEFLIEQYKEI